MNRPRPVRFTMSAQTAAGVPQMAQTARIRWLYEYGEGEGGGEECRMMLLDFWHACDEVLVI